MREVIIMPDKVARAYKQNWVALALQVLAYITYGVGLLVGFVIGNQTYEVPFVYSSGSYSVTEFSFTLALSYWAAALISGTVFLGFAELINLLQRLVDQGEFNLDEESNGTTGDNPEDYSDLPNL
jgi:hypothetical protein